MPITPIYSPPAGTQQGQPYTRALGNASGFGRPQQQAGCPPGQRRDPTTGRCVAATMPAQPQAGVGQALGAQQGQPTTQQMQQANQAKTLDTMQMALQAQPPAPRAPMEERVREYGPLRAIGQNIEDILAPGHRALRGERYKPFLPGVCGPGFTWSGTECVSSEVATPATPATPVTPGGTPREFIDDPVRGSAEYQKCIAEGGAWSGDDKMTGHCTPAGMQAPPETGEIMEEAGVTPRTWTPPEAIRGPGVAPRTDVGPAPELGTPEVLDLLRQQYPQMAETMFGFQGYTPEQEAEEISLRQQAIEDAYRDVEEDLAQQLRDRAQAQGMLYGGAGQEFTGKHTERLLGRKAAEKAAAAADVYGKRWDRTLQGQLAKQQAVQQFSGVMQQWGGLDLQGKQQQLQSFLGDKQLEYERDIANMSFDMDKFKTDVAQRLNISSQDLENNQQHVALMGLLMEYNISKARTGTEQQLAQQQVAQMMQDMSLRDRQHLMQLLSGTTGLLGGVSGY